MIHTDPHRQGNPEKFGPAHHDISQYKDLLEKLEGGEEFEFNPKLNALSAAERLDKAIEGKRGTLEAESPLELVQQRYVAAALGFEVSPNYYGSGSIRADVKYPDMAKLPELPQRMGDGKFYQADGDPVSLVQADAAYTAHYIANHPDEFKRSGAFRELFEGIDTQASQGLIEVSPDQSGDDPRGARSLIRQVARVLGYRVGTFKKEDGVFRLKVEGIRRGFDSNETRSDDLQGDHVGEAEQEPRKERASDEEALPIELDRTRLNELMAEAMQPGKYFGKDVELTGEDRRQFDLIAAKVQAYLEPLEDQPKWKEFMKLIDEVGGRGGLISFAKNEGTNNPSWCINGGEDPSIKEVRRTSEHGTSSGIQVPEEVFNTFHWKNTLEILEGYQKTSNETLKGRASKPLGLALKDLAWLVRHIEQGKN